MHIHLTSSPCQTAANERLLTADMLLSPGRGEHTRGQMSNAASMTTLGASSISQSHFGYSPVSSPEGTPRATPSGHRPDENRDSQYSAGIASPERYSESDVAKLRKVRQEFEANGHLLEEERNEVLQLAKQRGVTRDSAGRPLLRPRDPVAELAGPQRSLDDFMEGSDDLNFPSHIKRIQTFINEQHRFV